MIVGFREDLLDQVFCHGHVLWVWVDLINTRQAPRRLQYVAHDRQTLTGTHVPVSVKLLSETNCLIRHGRDQAVDDVARELL